MNSTFLAVSFDTADAKGIAGFWAQALGLTVDESASTGFASISASATSPRLMFHQVPEGKLVKNRLHLDILTTDLYAETARLVRLGATVLHAATPGNPGWSTLADPDGNEFDLIPS